MNIIKCLQIIGCVIIFYTNLHSMQQAQVVPSGTQKRPTAGKALHIAIMRSTLAACSNMPRPVIGICCSYVELEDPTPFLVCGLSNVFLSQADHCKLMVNGDQVIAIIFSGMCTHELFDVTCAQHVHKLPYTLQNCSAWPCSTLTCAGGRISNEQHIWDAKTGQLLQRKNMQRLVAMGKMSCVALVEAKRIIIIRLLI